MASSSSPKEGSKPTATQHDQWTVEDQCFQIFQLFTDLPRNAQSVMLELQRDKHIQYLTKGLHHLASSFCVLDANRPWLCYWILHSIALLGKSIDTELEKRAIDFLSRCQDPTGGYGGGPGQMPHLATTYAAVNSLITLGGHRSLSSINRDHMYNFLLRMKDANWGFRMHDGGEMDVRTCYTAISVASILNILDYDLIQNVGNYIVSCQTYEGGIAGEPGSEAHGGYTYCGLATMILIDEVHRLDVASLIDWVVFRQGRECGFQGRTNKLVDGCYSFWQGGTFALFKTLESVINEQIMMGAGGDCSTDSVDSDAASDLSEWEDNLDGAAYTDNETCQSTIKGLSGAQNPVNYSSSGIDYLGKNAEKEPLFHSMSLQHYILLCSQVQDGGFKDKPGKYRDFYHTCYCLSGLSVSQYSRRSRDADSPPLPSEVHGPYSNLLKPVHPLYNTVLDKYHEAHEFFSKS